MHFPDLVTTAISIVSLTDHLAQCVYKGLLTFTNVKRHFLMVMKVLLGHRKQ